MEPATVTIQTILTAMTTVLTSFYSMFGSIVSTIMDNPILFITVLFSITFGLISFALLIARKMGLRGMSAGGRRRRRGYRR